MIRSVENENGMRRIVTVLRFKPRKIDCPAVQPGRCTGLEPPHLKPQVPELVGQPDRRQISGPTARIIGQADMDQAAHKGAGGHDHGSAEKADTGAGIDTAQLAAFQIQRRHLALLEIQIVLLLQDPLHAQPVQLLVGLGPGGAHRRPLAGIEHAELDAGGIDILGHLAAQGIDLLDQMPLGQAADGRIARHQRNGIQIDGQQQRAAAHAGSSQGRLASGMPCTDNNHIIYGFITVHACTHVSRETRPLFPDTEG